MLYSRDTYKYIDTYLRVLAHILIAQIHKLGTRVFTFELIVYRKIIGQLYSGNLQYMLWCSIMYE